MYNLRQIERVVANGVEDQVLQLVDGRQQVVAESSHVAECGWKRGFSWKLLIAGASRVRDSVRGNWCQGSSLEARGSSAGWV